MEVKIGSKYRHFKGNIIEVTAIAKHTETLEDMVVYKHSDNTWVRPYSMFIERVDKEKYHDVNQEYRFELIDND